MSVRKTLPFVALSLLVSLAVASAAFNPAPAATSIRLEAAPAQTQTQKPYEPQVGQEGKDVVWVPTPQELAERMLDLANVRADDFVMDLGSGDGRTVIAAAKRGARALGVEYNPDMVELSRKNAIEAGVTDKASFVTGDLFETDLSKADVITMFLLPSINLKLRPIILDLEPGTRVVSNSFTMGDWEADDTHTLNDCANWCTAYLWYVPAKVDGMWETPHGTLRLTQTFQKIEGALDRTDIFDGRLRGAEITFSVGGTKYTGRVEGDTMRGSRAGDQTGSWTARRTGPITP